MRWGPGCVSHTAAKSGMRRIARGEDVRRWWMHDVGFVCSVLTAHDPSGMCCLLLSLLGTRSPLFSTKEKQLQIRRVGPQAKASLYGAVSGVRRKGEDRDQVRLHRSSVHLLLRKAGGRRR